MFRISERDMAMLQKESEFMEQVKEMNTQIDAGRISRRDARGILGGFAAMKVSASLGGSIDDIHEVINRSRKGRLSSAKKREAWDAGDPDLADRYNEEFVRNQVLPDMMRRMIAGETKEDLLDELRNDVGLSSHSMERIEAGMKHFSEVVRHKSAS